MACAENRVVMGDYRGAEILTILGEVFLSGEDAGKFPLSSDAVSDCQPVGEGSLSETVSRLWPDQEPHPENMRATYFVLRFVDGKECLLEVDHDLGKALLKNCQSKAKARCEVTPEKIKICNPTSREHCAECLCFPCVLWPNCCYGRLYQRRAARNHP